MSHIDQPPKPASVLGCGGPMLNGKRSLAGVSPREFYASVLFSPRLNSRIAQEQMIGSTLALLYSSSKVLDQMKPQGRRRKKMGKKASP